MSLILRTVNSAGDKNTVFSRSESGSLSTSVVCAYPGWKVLAEVLFRSDSLLPSSLLKAIGDFWPSHVFGLDCVTREIHAPKVGRISKEIRGSLGFDRS